jgi:hypothetical protein
VKLLSLLYLAWFVVAPVYSLPEVGRPLQTQSQTVKLSVAVGARAAVSLVLRVGSKATIALDAERKLGLSATPVAGELNLEIRELSKPDNGAVVQTVRLLSGITEQVTVLDTVLELRWSDEPGPPTGAQADADCSDCCITCESIQYCACKVVTVCAECCCWQCCHIITSGDEISKSSPAMCAPTLVTPKVARRP